MKGFKNFGGKVARILDRKGQPLKDPPRPMIVILSGDQVATEFALSLSSLTLLSNPKPTGLGSVRSALVHNARNMAVEWTKQQKGTHILFLDSDMRFPVETLSRLLDHDEDIVAATYPKRVPPHDLLFKLLPGVERVQASEGLVEVAALPTGCMLINMRVFEKLQEPYFRLPSWAVGETIPEPLRYYCQGPMDDNGVTQVVQGMGEDNYFCAMARAAGFKIQLDVALTTHIGHVGQEIWFAAGEPVPTPTEEPARGATQTAH